MSEENLENESKYLIISYTTLNYNPNYLIICKFCFFLFLFFFPLSLLFVFFFSFLTFETFSRQSVGLTPHPNACKVRISSRVGVTILLSSYGLVSHLGKPVSPRICPTYTDENTNIILKSYFLHLRSRKLFDHTKFLINFKLFFTFTMSMFSKPKCFF